MARTFQRLPIEARPGKRAALAKVSWSPPVDVPARNPMTAARPDDATARPAPAARLSRRQWAWVTLGVAVWIALGAGGVWFVHAVTKPKTPCVGTGDAQTTQARGTTAPGNGFSVLTGQASCK